MRATLKNEVLAERMGRVIAKHPSEWQSDDECSKWEHLKDLVPDDAAFEEAKNQILEMVWWDDVSCAGADLPVGPEVYHLNPISYSTQLLIIEKTASIAIEARIRAFLRMIRVGEGTVGAVGYETIFGGESFIKDYNKDWSTHPEIYIPFGKTTSSAAGAYQVLAGTWNEYKQRAKKYGVTSFSKTHQDIFAVTLLKHKVKGNSKEDHFNDKNTGKRLNALDLIIDDRIDDAIKISSYEWASLPPSRYGQPSTSPLKAKQDYNTYLNEELSGNSDLEIKFGGLTHFFQKEK
jgi:muramidase (phage lysozyme)